jgi:hypothetical protein
MTKDTPKLTYTKARAKAAALDEKLLATDKRLDGSVIVVHQDGSIFYFNRAFVLQYQDFAIILTEHHGPHVYATYDLKDMRALGPRMSIKKTR